MKYDVFISYSSQDEIIANAICHKLEANNIRCWIAPRNIPPGTLYARGIMDGIKNSTLFVLIYTKNANCSQHVANEIDNAFKKGKTIIPFLIDTTPMCEDFEYYLSRKQQFIGYPDYKERSSELLSWISQILEKGEDWPVEMPESQPDNSKQNITKKTSHEPLTQRVEIDTHNTNSVDSKKIEKLPRKIPIIAPNTTSTIQKSERNIEKQNITEKVSHVSLTPRTFQVKGVEFTMIPVEGGTFTMGATSEQGSDTWDREKPTHRVTLSDYYIGEVEVTQALWQAVMGDNPSYFKGDLQRPVEYVSWNECQEFIKKLNALTGQNFRLPTEAEWEYAARGGNKSKGYKYAGSNNIDDVAWYDDNSNDMTHFVKGKQANELGLYDMSGNVWEWCSDWYGDYSSSAQTNPTGPATGSDRVIRGGSWFNYAGDCRVSLRDYDAPDNRIIGLGLRLALSNPIQLSKANFEKSEKDNKDKDFNLRSIRVNGVEFNMIPVKGGTFTMGATPEQGIDAEIVEKPSRQVSLGDYYIGETVVTQALWEVVMGYNPSCFKGPNLAVDNVSWYECKEFIARINKISGLNFNLPTEAEWEYAARGGNMSNGYKYAGSNDIEDVAWFDENSSSISHSVKTKKANELGIYDMSGTIWEWCYDWATDYSQCTNLNPMGPTQSTSRKVLRGGAYSSRRRFCRVSSRSNNTPETKSSTIGFRITLVK